MQLPVYNIHNNKATTMLISYTTAYSPRPPSSYLSSPSVGQRLWVVSVGLSCYCLGHYPSMHPPLSCRGGQIISSPHTRMLRHHLCFDICPSPTRPLPRKQLSPKLLPRLCYRMYGGQMPTMVIFRGHASGEGANAQHTLRINAVMILLV